MLNDLLVKKAKATEKVLKLSDGDGLILLVKPTGGKIWHFRYRRPVGGKENTLSLGSYPEVTLSMARLRRLELRRMLEQGVDPSVQRQAEAQVERDTFEVVAREWFNLFTTEFAEKHAHRIMIRLEQDIFPLIGALPVGAVRAPDLVQVLRRVEQRSIQTAHRVRINLGQIFRYAVATGKAESDPTTALRGTLPNVRHKHHPAPLDHKEIGRLLSGIDGYQGSAVVRTALQLLALTFVRPGELRNAQWAEIDLERSVWEIPAARMKMKQPHLVPLSRQAVDLLRWLQTLTGNGPLVFPGRNNQRPLSDTAMNAALRYLGWGPDEMTGHGFRAMARTILDEELSYRPDYIEHQLAHAVRDPLGRAYNRTTHLPQRVEMMQRWADWLDQVKG